MSFLLLDGLYVMTSHYANLICLSINVLLELEFDKKTLEEQYRIFQGKSA